MAGSEKAREVADAIWKCADGAPGTTYSEVWKRRSFEIIEAYGLDQRIEEAEWWYDYHWGKPQSGKLGIERLNEVDERLTALKAERQKVGK